MANLRIESGTTANDAVVHLDGQDISRALRGLRVNMAVDEVTTAELDVVVVELTSIDLADVQVHIPDATRQLLERAGWTPPADPDQGQLR